MVVEIVAKASLKTIALEEIGGLLRNYQVQYME